MKISNKSFPDPCKDAIIIAHFTLPRFDRYVSTNLNGEENKGIRDAGSTADFRILFEVFEILEILIFFET